MLLKFLMLSAKWQFTESCWPICKVDSALGWLWGCLCRAWWGFRLEERKQVGEGHRDTWAEPSQARSSSPEAEHLGSMWMSPQTSVQSWVSEVHVLESCGKETQWALAVRGHWSPLSASLFPQHNEAGPQMFHHHRQEPGPPLLTSNQTIRESWLGTFSSSRKLQRDHFPSNEGGMEGIFDLGFNSCSWKYGTHSRWQWKIKPQTAGF